MKLPRRRYWVPLVLLVLLIVVARFDLHYHILGWLRGDAYYQGLPTSYWRDAATFQLKGPSSWRQTIHRWTRLPLPEKDQRFSLFTGDPEAMAVLGQLIGDSATDEEVRIGAIYAVTRVGPERAVLSDDIRAVLENCRREPGREIRFAAASQLLWFEDDIETSAKVIMEIISQQITDSSANERAIGAYRLIHLGRCKAVDPAPIFRMLHGLQNDPDGRVREQANHVMEIIIHWHKENDANR